MGYLSTKSPIVESCVHLTISAVLNVFQNSTTAMRLLLLLGQCERVTNREAQQVLSLCDASIGEGLLTLTCDMNSRRVRELLSWLASQRFMRHLSANGSVTAALILATQVATHRDRPSFSFPSKALPYVIEGLIRLEQKHQEALFGLAADPLSFSLVVMSLLCAYGVHEKPLSGAGILAVKTFTALVEDSAAACQLEIAVSAIAMIGENTCECMEFLSKSLLELASRFPQLAKDVFRDQPPTRLQVLRRLLSDAASSATSSDLPPQPLPGYTDASASIRTKPSSIGLKLSINVASFKS
jgi:hypothetical protein